MTNTKKNGKRFWVLSILIAVVLTVTLSFAFSPVRSARAEEKERPDIERIEDKPYLEDFKELEINVVKTYPSVSSSAKSLRSSFSTYSYLWIFVKPAAISSEYEGHRTFTLRNQPNLTEINWGDNTASTVTNETTLSHVYTSSGNFIIMLTGVTAFENLLCSFNDSFINVTTLQISSEVLSIGNTVLGPLYDVMFHVSEGNPNFCTENYNSFPEGSSSRSSGHFLLSKSGKNLIRCGFNLDNYTVTIPYGIECLYNGSCFNAYGYSNPTRCLIIPDSVTSINQGGIYNLSSLKDIVIGSGLESIGLQGIYNCSSLERVIIKSTVPPSLDSNVFTNCNDCNFYVPAESVDTYKADSSWEDYSERIFAMTEEMEEEYYTGDPALLVEPTTPDEPNTEPTDPTETNTDEKKPFDFGEWIYNASENVSAWLGENVGIATTGSTVLIIGAVIIVVILLKKRI